MPIYFFHLRRSGKTILDPDGTLLASPEEAHRAAVLDARDLIIAVLNTEDAVPLADGIEIADESGVIMRTVSFKDALRKLPAEAVP
jgi:hypothetical protein